MKYQIIETEKPSPWWKWLPPFTIFTASRFPYMVYVTKTEYPWGRIHQCCSTKWGAKRLAKRLSCQSAKQHEYVVVDEVQS